MPGFKRNSNSRSGNFNLRSDKSAKPVLRIGNSNADADTASIRFVKNSASPSGSVHASVGPSVGTDASDVIGAIDFYSDNDNGDQLNWGRIRCESIQVTDGSENASMIFTTQAYGDAGGLLESARTNPMVGTTTVLGFGTRRPTLILASGTTLTLQPEHSGIIVHLNDAFSSGMTITLPDDSGANGGFWCTIFIGVTQTGALTIQSAADDDLMLGAIHAISSAAKADAFAADGSSHDKITMDANNKGRMAGTVIHCYLMGADKWLVEGHTICTGTPADPWAD